MICIFRAQGPQLSARDKLRKYPAPRYRILPEVGSRSRISSPARWWTCRSRTPPPGPGFPRSRMEKDTSSTACTTRGFPPMRGGLGHKMLRQVFHANQRDFLRYSTILPPSCRKQRTRRPSGMSRSGGRFSQTDLPALIAAMAEHAALGQSGTDPARCRGMV